nr:eukaryotic translation initiation factor 4E type 1B [Vicugna pacos]
MWNLICAAERHSQLKRIPPNDQCHVDGGQVCRVTAVSPALSLHAGDAEGGNENWRKDKEEKEEEEAAAGALVGEEALCAPTALLSLSRKAPDRGPTESKLELHPLLSRWALWFFKNDRSRAWQDNLHLVTKFDTVEDFWAMYSNIQLASKLSSGCDYALFKDGIEPMWEDSRNKRGGRWLVSLAKQQRHSELDHLWLETLLFLIGESFEEHSREVCGAVINIRAKGDKIAVWTREAENQAGVLHIGRVYKECLGLSSKTIIGYQAHADTATKSNSLAKNKFVV